MIDEMNREASSNYYVNLPVRPPSTKQDLRRWR